MVGLKECVTKRIFPSPSVAGLFRHCRPLAALQVTSRKDMEILHKYVQPLITHFLFFWCLLDPPKTCSFVGFIKLCPLLKGLFWDAVDSFVGLFDGFYYIFTGESTSKDGKFDNFCSTKILNMPLTQTNPGIRTKRHVLEQSSQTKGCKFGGPGDSRLGRRCWADTTERPGVGLAEELVIHMLGWWSKLLTVWQISSALRRGALLFESEQIRGRAPQITRWQDVQYLQKFAQN